MPPAITSSNMPRNVIRLMYSHRIFASGRILLPEHAGYRIRAVGLAICRMIVERHGGQLSVTSADQGGASFRVTLP